MDMWFGFLRLVCVCVRLLQIYNVTYVHVHVHVLDWLCWAGWAVLFVFSCLCCAGLFVLC